MHQVEMKRSCHFGHTTAQLTFFYIPSLAVIMAAAQADPSNNARLADVDFLLFLPLHAEAFASSIIQTTQHSICNPIVLHRHALTNNTQIQFPFHSQY